MDGVAAEPQMTWTRLPECCEDSPVPSTGFRAVTGMNNTRYWIERPVKWEFNSAKDADYFRDCVGYYSDDEILKGLKVKPRNWRR